MVNKDGTIKSYCGICLFDNMNNNSCTQEKSYIIYVTKYNVLF